MKYLQFKISIENNYQEPLIAELEEMDFEGYQQLDYELIAYIPQENIQIGDRKRIEQLLAAYPGQNFIQTEKTVKEKNWNREWEKTIRPQTVGNFLIRPTWLKTKPEENQILLEVDPKMAFGNGYHATTKLILQILPKFIEKGYKVLDAGTGTGILAIAAAKLGASKITAFDTNQWSVENAKENILLNKVKERVEVSHGSIETVKEGEMFDTVWANINRNSILEMIPAFSKMLNKEGFILVSGFLKKDQEAVSRRLKENGLKPIKAEQQEEWIAACAKK